ncbi:pyridoxamine 5'-phosphate oxidase [Hygrophoropsis aurantiaca]|uniref:Pyridoxamine 5'-phosphate oxidase n=1 Tax=Hygrophoropsis aurantiaca TaxID=72124 RepID=A0ACB8AEQ4_9AGAM|nr:pyridoxamine 5'-phosphate oxidase [Hygrophoropsis aurantiaca]
MSPTEPEPKPSTPIPSLQITSHPQYNPPSSLSPSSVHSSPFTQFHEWFTAAQAQSVPSPEATALSTASSTGIPSSRMVLLRSVDLRGFVFYTNYTSRKSQELNANGSAALLFYWPEMDRQVRVVGRVEKVGKEESEAYFRTRPVGSQVGAWASRQSSVIGEGELSEQVDKREKQFGVGKHEREGGEVLYPEFWGGWRVIPSEVEFWLGKPSRLHDRVRYLRKEGSSDDKPEWTIERLAP